MMAARHILLALVCSFSLTQQVNGQKTGPWYKNETELTIRNCLADFKSKGAFSRQELAIISSIVIRVIDQELPEGLAYFEESGAPAIRITAGLIYQLDNLADAFVIEQQLRRPGLFDQYRDYLIRCMSQTAAKLKSSGEIGHVLNARHVFASGLLGDKIKVPDDTPEQQKARRGFLEASIVFLLFHEIAHHVLGHLRESQRDLMERVSKEEQLRRSRARELQADLWSVRTAFRVRYNVLAALPMFALFSDGLEADPGGTHPARLRRTYEIVSGSVAAMRRDAQYLAGLPPSERDVIVRDLESILERMGKLLQ